MASRMMQAEASKNNDLDLNKLMSLFGRLYQLRDDYEDIGSSSTNEYNDIDEGSFTLPLLHALQQDEDSGSLELYSILQSARRERVSPEMKQLVKEKLEAAGSLDFTRMAIRELYLKMEDEQGKMEEVAGIKNWILRLLMLQLRI